MLLFLLLKAFHINSDAVFLCHFLGNLNREAESVIQTECDTAGDFHLGVLLQVRQQLLELCLTGLERLAELVLLKRKLFLNKGSVLRKFRIGILILTDYYGSGLFKEGTFNTELASVADCTADNSAQNITGTSTSRSNSLGVTQDKGSRTRMVGNNTDCSIISRISTVLLAGDLLYALYNWKKNVCLIHRFLSVQDRNRSLNAHSGINAFAGHLVVIALSVLIVAHEYVIPDFKVLTAVTARLAVRTAFRLAVIVENLGIRTTRTCLSRRPPPVVASWQEENMVACDSHLFPALSSFLIARNLRTVRLLFAFKDSHVELFFWNAQILWRSKELVAVFNGFMLKIGTKTPVTKHLKECKVARITYGIYITSSDTFLIVCKLVSRRMRFTQQIRNKRLHSGSRKKNRGIIIRKQRLSADFYMSLRLKKLNIFRTQLIYGHSSL